MNSIFDNDDISKFKPFVHNFITAASACTIVILLVTISIVISGDEVNSAEKLFILFNVILIALEIGFYFIIKKGTKFIRNYSIIINKSGNADEMDIVFNIRSKFKFIKDAEQHIHNNMEKLINKGRKNYYSVAQKRVFINNAIIV